jgi:hypothetical protein
MLATLLAHPICRKRLSELRPADFADYRDERLLRVKPVSLKRELAPIRHLFEFARDEWGLPIKENPLAKFRWKGADRRRERRLRTGELADIIPQPTPLVSEHVRAALAHLTGAYSLEEE